MSTQTITVSTELMKNYKQTLLMSPEKKFEALQTDKGHSLLFSIGTDEKTNNDAFYVTQETVGHNTGWEKTNMSSAQIAKSFPGQNGLTCKTFEAAQSAVDKTIGVAMVISDANGNDHLFLSLGNSHADTGWTKHPAWVQYEFDNPTKNINIAGVFLAETADQEQYIVADILRDPLSPKKLISRYFINTSGQPAWQPHDVSIDLEADTYNSCLGRQHLSGSPVQPTIDGIYSSGQIDGNAQLTFRPLYDEDDPPRAALPVKLELPAGVIANAIASCRKSDLSTDLYLCAADTGLYYFASTNQNTGPNNTPPIALLLSKNAMFNGVHKMYAHQHGNTVVVWGLNGNNEVFYTSCRAGQETSPSAWSTPSMVAAQVDLFSPYINLVDGGNTFFAVAENTLEKVIKSPQTSLWKTQSITLPTPDIDNKLANTQKYSSYTTRIRVTDANHQPIAKAAVSISSRTRTGVYINHLYYVLDPTGIDLVTDELGSVTVVEWVSSLTGTRLKVSGLADEINPMDTPFKKAFSPDSKTNLNSKERLKSATISDDDGTPSRLLVSSNANENDLDAVASSNTKFNTVYDAIVKKESLHANAWALDLAAPAFSPVTIRVNGVENVEGFFSDIGDFFRWLGSKIEEGFEVLMKWIDNAWNFIVTIAEKTYNAILTAVEHVIAGVEWVMQQIKTAIEDVIKFVEYFFGWEDILNTHNAMKSIFTHLVDEASNNLSKYKTDVATGFTNLKQAADKWAKLPDFGQSSNGINDSNSGPGGMHSAPSNFGLHHYQGNTLNSKTNFSPATFAEDVLQKIIDLLKEAGGQLWDTFKEIKSQIIDQFGNLSVTDVIKKLIVLVFDALMDFAQDIIVFALDCFIELVDVIKGVLTATIDIPVISWLYRKMTGNDLSFLDLICLVAAIPATIVYKFTSDGVAPFPKDDPFTINLKNAKSFQDIRNAFFTSPPQAEGGLTAAGLPVFSQPVLNGKALKAFAMTSCVFALAGSVVLVITTTVSRLLEIAELPAPKSLATITAIANIAYVSPNIPGLINAKTDNWYQELNNAFTGVSILKGFINIFVSGELAPKASAMIESYLNAFWNVPVIDNIIDNKNLWNANYKALIPESIGNFCFNIGGMMEFPITIDPDITSKGLTSLAQFGFMALYGVFMPIAGGIYMGDDQTDW